MKRRFATADVFTTTAFAGNPVAVVLDAEGLTDAQMQALAVEFNYIETTFVLPPADPAHTARVRIFTPDRELAFAGHPNLGTAFLLARTMQASGDEVPVRFVFEEAAGLVPVELLSEGGDVVGAELLAPQTLTHGGTLAPERAAACLQLTAADLQTQVHPPAIVSVGLPFLVMELASRDALRRASPDRSAFDAVLPLDGAHSVYAYVRGVPGDGYDLHSRMFTARMVEDPATGSATAALTAFLAALGGEMVQLRVQQGADMGRPSTLQTRSVRSDAGIGAHLGGRCVSVFEGYFELT